MSGGKTIQLKIGNDLFMNNFPRSLAIVTVQTHDVFPNLSLLGSWREFMLFAFALSVIQQPSPVIHRRKRGFSIMRNPTAYAWLSGSHVNTIHNSLLTDNGNTTE
jgi:hypothetical protein